MVCVTMEQQCTPRSSLRCPAEQYHSAVGAAPVGRTSVHKVLVVDDQRDLADLAEILFNAHGVEAVIAYSGAEALAALERDPEIDAVFSDVMMPGMNGIELAAEVKRRYPSARMVLTSGYALPSLLAEQPVGYCFVSKPYTVAHVLALLQS